jgi:hypothetical protein
MSYLLAASLGRQGKSPEFQAVGRQLGSYSDEIPAKGEHVAHEHRPGAGNAFPIRKEN